MKIFKLLALVKKLRRKSSKREKENNRVIVEEKARKITPSFKIKISLIFDPYHWTIYKSIIKL